MGAVLFLAAVLAVGGWYFLTGTSNGGPDEDR